MRRHLLSPSLTLSLLLGAAAATQAAPYVFINIEPPGPGGPPSPAAINESGQVVGSYQSHAFLWEHGDFNTIDPPGAVEAQAHDINDAGQVVGHYDDSSGTRHGFLWSEGDFTVIDPPGATSSSALAISAAGQIVGSFSDSPCGSHGFLWDEGTFTTLDAVPCSESSFGSTGANGINAAGQIIGAYTDGFETTHGFLWANGTFTTIDGPDAEGTRTFAINDAGQVVGVYYLPTTIPQGHAFLYDGTFTTIDPPDAVGDAQSSLVAIATDVNAAGLVLGYYQDSTLLYTTQISLYQDGTFTRIDGPTATSATASGINLAGDIIGTYLNSSGRHSFVARPATSVSGLVHLNSMTTSFDGTPVPGGPAGTFTITASFTNASSTPIFTPQFDVTTLSKGNRLLNADVPPGTVGARLTPGVGSDGVLSPGESLDVHFAIGLQQRRTFTFRIGLLGVNGP